jgi:Ribonucleotide reductase, barrel domain
VINWADFPLLRYLLPARDARARDDQGPDSRAKLIVQHRRNATSSGAQAASVCLTETRGPFPAFADSRFADSRPVRHAKVTSVAPTGTISLIAGTTAGIEPMFAIASTFPPRSGPHFRPRPK